MISPKKLDVTIVTDAGAEKSELVPGQGMFGGGDVAGDVLDAICKGHSVGSGTTEEGVRYAFFVHKTKLEEE